MENQNYDVFEAMTQTQETETTKETNDNDNDNGNDLDNLDLNTLIDTELLAAVIVPATQSLNKLVMRLALKNKVDVSKYNFKNAEELEKILSLWLKTIEIKDPKKIIGWILAASFAESLGSTWGEAISDMKKVNSETPPTKEASKETKFIDFKKVLEDDKKK